MSSEFDLEKQAGESVTNPIVTSERSNDTPYHGPSKSSFTFQNVGYTVDTPKGKKTILEGVDGCVQKGSVGSSNETYC
jgi:hypothetical protein